MIYDLSSLSIDLKSASDGNKFICMLKIKLFFVTIVRPNAPVIVTAVIQDNSTFTTSYV